MSLAATVPWLGRLASPERPEEEMKKKKVFELLIIFFCSVSATVPWLVLLVSPERPEEEIKKKKSY